MKILKMNRTISRIIAEKVERTAKNQCYSNSYLSLLADTVLDGNARYCEGYVVSKGLIVPIHHGFISIQGNAVVDVTLQNIEDEFRYISLLELSRYDLERLTEYVFSKNRNITLPLYDFHVKDIKNCFGSLEKRVEVLNTDTLCDVINEFVLTVTKEWSRAFNEK